MGSMLRKVNIEHFFEDWKPRSPSLEVTSESKQKGYLLQTVSIEHFLEDWIPRSLSPEVTSESK